MVPYRRIFEELEARNLRYLVAGGFAVNFHQVQRATVDLDLILDLESGNVVQFLELMGALGYVPRLPVNVQEFADAKKRAQWITEKGLMVFSFIHPANHYEVVDVFAQEPIPFNELWARRLDVAAFGITIKVIGKDDLITLKQRAGRDKDEFDIRQLKKD